MPRETKRLNARSVATITATGRHADGDGLYLIVGAGGAKRWEFHFRMGGAHRNEMGLGSVGAVSLADGRQLAAEARKLVAAGINPIEARREAIKAAELDKARGITFGEFAEEVADALAGGFRNQKHIDQWRTTLSVQRDRDGKLLDTGYCVGIREKRLDEIDTDLALGILSPIWSTKPETASRLRGRLERVLDAAKAKKLRQGENPAAWRGNLKSLLSKRQKLSRGHHAAMPYVDVPAFVGKLAESAGVGAMALKFLILTASRTGEIIGARWREIDFDAGIWVVPADRMKAGREHRVPLVPAAVAMLRSLHEVRRSEFVFPGSRAASSISSATMTKAMVTAGAGDFTVHGFRSSFRDWCGEVSTFPREIAEAALAHQVGDETERAYRRGDALAKRRKLMEAWANYCLAPIKGNVVPIRKRTAAD